jgi:hypothetical protein
MNTLTEAQKATAKSVSKIEAKIATLESRVGSLLEPGMATGPQPISQSTVPDTLTSAIKFLNNVLPLPLVKKYVEVLVTKAIANENGVKREVTRSKPSRVRKEATVDEPSGVTRKVAIRRMAGEEPSSTAVDEIPQTTDSPEPAENETTPFPKCEDGDSVLRPKRGGDDPPQATLGNLVRADGAQETKWKSYALSTFDDTRVMTENLVDFMSVLEPGKTYLCGPKICISKHESFYQLCKFFTIDTS